MKKKIVRMAFLFLMMGAGAMAQETEPQTQTEPTQLTAAEKTTEEENIPTVSHTVQMGETVILICKKYVVSPDDIYKLNPEAIDGITPGMVLRVPSQKKVVAQKPKAKPVDTSITSHADHKEQE